MCACVRVRAQGKLKADRNRARVEENFLKQTHAQRQEAAQTRREEKKRAEKERIMNEEDPERQRRLEVRRTNATGPGGEGGRILKKQQPNILCPFTRRWVSLKTLKCFCGSALRSHQAAVLGQTFLGGGGDQFEKRHLAQTAFPPRTEQHNRLVFF